MDQSVMLTQQNVSTSDKVDELFLLGNLPLRWPLVRLGDLCEDSTSINPEKTPEKSFTYIDVSSVSNQEFRVIETKEIKGEDAPSRARKHIKSGDVIFATVRPALKRVAIIPPKLDDQVCSTGFCVLRARRELLDPEYLYFHLLTEKVTQYGAALEKGATYPAINDTELLNLSITLPPLAEQQAITYVLQTVQNAIQSRRKEIELERERKVALMHYLFTHGIWSKPTKESEIGDIPEGWKVLRLGALSKIRYGLGQPPEKDDNGTPMIRATDIKSGRIIKSSVIKVKREAIPESRAQFLKKGDIIVVRSGAYTGDVAMYDGEWETAIAGYDLVVSPLDEEVNPSFIAHYLLSDANQSYFRSQRDRSAQSHINAEQLSNAVIPFPALSEQNTISEVLQSASSKIAALEKELSLNEELFRALLEELMTGRLSALPPSGIAKEQGL